MEDPTRAQSWKRRIQPRVALRLFFLGGGAEMGPRGCVWWKSKVQHQTERKRSAVRPRHAGELASGNEAQFPSGIAGVVATVLVRSFTILPGEISRPPQKRAVVVENERTRR